MYIELMNKNEVTLAKHSAVIQISNKISAIQRKCYNAFLYVAKKQLEENPGRFEFEIDAKVLLEFFQIGDKNYNILKEKLKELRKIEVEYNILGKDKTQQWGIFNLIAGIEYKESKFIFSFPHQVLKVLINPNIYTYIDLVIIKDLKSKYAVALYELLRDYRKIKELIIEVDKLKKLLGTDKTTYSFHMFKKRVIEKAIDEINKSEKIDFYVEYESKKSGRKYSHIKFIIKDKPKNIQLVNNVRNQKVDLLLEYIPEKYRLQCVNLLNKALNSYSFEYLQYQIEYTNAQENLKNYIAYLKQAIKEDYADYKNQAERARIAEEEKKRRQEEERAIREQIMKLQKRQKEIEDEAKKEFAELSKDEQEKLIQNNMGLLKSRKIAKITAIAKITKQKMQEHFTEEELELLERARQLQLVEMNE